MKVTASKPTVKFQPITISITLESRREFDTLAAIADRNDTAVANCLNDGDGPLVARARPFSPEDVGAVTGPLYRALSGIAEGL